MGARSDGGYVSRLELKIFAGEDGGRGGAGDAFAVEEAKGRELRLDLTLRRFLAATRARWTL